MITFKYKQEPIGTNNDTIKRPVADVFLKVNDNHWIEFHPYIDSGADITIIPLSLGRLLGLTLDEKNVTQVGGIRGSVPIINSHIQMRIGNQEFSCRCAWSLVEDVPPLLGRTDIFDIFEITFRQQKDTIDFVPTK